MCQSPQRYLDAASHDRHVGEQTFEDIAIDDGGVVRTGTGTAVGCIGIVTALAAGCSIVIDHRVHRPGRYAEVQPWTSQFFEITQVIAPVGLRHDSDFVTVGLQHAPDDGSAHRRVVDIGVTGEQDNVGLLPTQVVHLLAGSGQPLPLDVVVGISLVLLHFLSVSNP